MDMTSQSLEAALRHHHAGRLHDAEQIYRQILAVEPNHADAWNLLGVVNSQRGNHQTAADYIRRAILRDENQTTYHNNLGNACKELGELDEAIACYRRALELKPDYGDVHNNLGNVFREQGKLDEAVACYRRALDLAPGIAEVHNNLGNALREQARHDEAIACYRRALELKPDYAVAHNNLGNVFKELAETDQAIASYRRALELQPNYIKAHNNLGTALAALGKRDEAIACYQRALELKPDYANAYYNLGIVLQECGKPNEAVDCYRRTLQLNPNFAEAHYNLANTLRELGNGEEVIACYLRALELKPHHAKAQSNLGTILQEQGKLEEALPRFRRAIELEPNLAEASCNLATVLRDLGKADDAVVWYRKALELKPDDPDIQVNLGNAFNELRKHDEAVAWYRRAVELKPDYVAARACLVHQLQHLCQWDDDLNGLSQRVIDSVDQADKNVLATPVSPFTFLTQPAVTTARQQLQCARQCMEKHLKLPADFQRNLAADRRSRPKKLTIGYLSADYQAHATALLIAQLFEKHSRDRFAIFGYSYGRDDGSPMRQRLVSAMDRFVDVKDFAYLQAAERIAADEVDILVDLKGYTADTRSKILTFRPAPIQVNYLGYPGTMGAPFVDYILVDDFVVPADQQPFYTEKLVHLPGCYQANDSGRPIAPHTPSRAECGLPEHGFVFCSFNNNYKITREVFGVWMKLLEAVPLSVLWLLEGNGIAVANLRREATERGIAAERLVFAPRVEVPEHLARHRLADLFLDTFPVNAHTTASDALWAGCPLVTIAGQTFVSRVAGSLLRALGLTELITTSLAEYEALALRLARDPGQLAELRARLAANRATSAVFDGARFARTLERAYETMWEIYAAGEPPRAFQVSPT